MCSNLSGTGQRQHFNFALCHVECLAAAHGHHPHPTRGEIGEHDSISFYYDHASHYLITITKSTCFCAALVRDEYDHIHSDIGMDDLELTMMRQWIGKLPETKIYHDDKVFPSTVLSHCRGHDIYFLERGNTTLVGTTKTPAASATSTYARGA